MDVAELVIPRPRAPACACARLPHHVRSPRPPTWSDAPQRGTPSHLFLCGTLATVAESPVIGQRDRSTVRSPGARRADTVEVDADELVIPNPLSAPGPILTLSPEEISRFFVARGATRTPSGGTSASTRRCGRSSSAPTTSSPPTPAASCSTIPGQAGRACAPPPDLHRRVRPHSGHLLGKRIPATAASSARSTAPAAPTAPTTWRPRTRCSPPSCRRRAAGRSSRPSGCRSSSANRSAASSS
jgi:hypothetical protein